MAKVRVISMFFDKTDCSRVFQSGQVVEFEDEERVRTIVERGLGVIVDDNSEVSLTIVKEDTPKKASTKKKTMKKR